MKIFLPATLFILLIAAQAEEPLVGWEKMLSQTQQGKARLDPPPTVEIEGFEGDFIEVKLTNVSNETLLYGGYSPESPQLFVKRKVEDKWVPGGWDWCGTGMSGYKLEPGKSAAFKIYRGHIGAQVFAVFSSPSGRSSIVRLYTPKSEQDGADQPATAPEPKSEGDSKTQPESEGRSQ